MPLRPSYRKGDQHSGGGGARGAGGKKRRPATGWRKSDAFRDADLAHTERKIPIKPGRASDLKARIKARRRARGRARTIRPE
jgi:hypothetical protein